MAMICWIVIVVQGMKKYNIVYWMTPLIALGGFRDTHWNALIGTQQIKTSPVLNQLRVGYLRRNSIAANSNKGE